MLNHPTECSGEPLPKAQVTKPNGKKLKTDFNKNGLLICHF